MPYRLALREASVGELAEPFAISQPAIPKHVKVRERAGLVSPGQAAQRRPRRLEGAPVKEAEDWLKQLRQVWEANYSRLDALLVELQSALKKEPRGEK